MTHTRSAVLLRENKLLLSRYFPPGFMTDFKNFNKMKKITLIHIPNKHVEMGNLTTEQRNENEKDIFSVQSRKNFLIIVQSDSG